jgi:CHASE2 domain-containing sensor protein
MPLPLLIALAGLAVIASIGCVVGGGHPPVLPLLLIVAGVVLWKKRHQERRA